MEIDTTSEDGEDNTPKGLGLKDASMVAFLLGGSVKRPEFWVEFSNVDELYPDDDEEL